MFRVLTVAAAIAGTAIGLAPFAGADPALGGADEPGRYPTDVPGMNYQAVNGAPCDNHDIFIFGRGPGGASMACHEHFAPDFVREDDNDLAQKIMDNMFTFEDMNKLDDKGFQSVLKEVQSESLVLALKGADDAIKEKVFKTLDEVMKPGAILASNTSTLPITGLAEAWSKPDNFIGIHFFSPVEKMRGPTVRPAARWRGGCSRARPSCMCRASASASSALRWAM